LNLAIEKPQWVDGLGLYGSTLFYDGWTIPRVARLSFMLPLVCGLGFFKQRRFMESFPYGIKDERVRMRIAGAMFDGQSEVAGLPGNPWPSLAEFHKLVWHVRPRLQDVRAPALIMHAADDDIASLRNARLIEQRVTGPTETVLLNDSYHMITVDGERDKVIGRSADFFTRILANSPLRISRPRITTAAHPSIDAFAPIEWNYLFPHDLEDHAYLRAAEHAGLPDFRYLYFAAREGDRLLAAVPAFITDYRLDTTMRGGVRRAAGTLAKIFPRVLRIPMLSLGSPVTERCRVGFASDATAEQRAASLDAILAHMETVAANQRLGMLAVKDAPLAETLWQQVCPRHRLRALPGLPGAMLDIRWHDIDGYLNSLRTSTRKDLRRKLRDGAALRIEWRIDLDGIADDVQ